MYRLLIALMLGIVLFVFGCDMAKDTADTTDDGSGKAVGIAEKMSQGTVGDTDENTGEAVTEGE